MSREIPEHVSWRVRDAWLAIPPCTYSENPYCHVDCPYMSDCHSDEDESDMDEWEKYFEERSQL